MVQYQRYESAVKYLTHATFNNLGLRSGGTKQTLELHRRAVDIYEAEIKSGILEAALPLHCIRPTHITSI